MARTRYDIDTCMDILDWFGDPDYEYLAHILLSKLDGDQRIARAMPEIRKRAQKLIRLHRGLDDAYPEGLLNLPA